MVDGSMQLDAQDVSVAQGLQGRKVIVVVNKADQPLKADISELQKLFPLVEQVCISALEKKNIDQLKDKILECVLEGHQIDPGALIVSNARHVESLEHCAQALVKTQKFFSEQLSLEFIAEEIKVAINCLDQVTGRNINQDLLEKIFSSFCIGK
jgi:tRNA modification GTPase